MGRAYAVVDVVASALQQCWLDLLFHEVRAMNRFRRFPSVALAALLLSGSLACSRTVEGVVQDTRDNTAKTKAAVETLDVKSAILADKTIDAGAIDVDTYADTKTVVLRGSVPTEAQKARAEQIAREHAPSYKVDNRLAVVPF
jgi:hyperosmotically inducible protein